MVTTSQLEPEVGDECEARYHEDGEFYAAKVTRVWTVGEKYEVLFTDYGNKQNVCIRPGESYWGLVGGGPF